jgi:hypothetical protein
MQKTIENSDNRALTDAELNDANGGILPILGRIAIGIGMTIIENQDHNGGRGTITMGELLQRHGY